MFCMCQKLDVMLILKLFLDIFIISVKQHTNTPNIIQMLILSMPPFERIQPTQNEP